MRSIARSFPARLAGLLLGVLLVSPALAASPKVSPKLRVADGQKPIVLSTTVVNGRIAKPSVTILLGRSFRAPTGLMSAQLWAERDARAAAARR